MKLEYFTAPWCQPCKVFGPTLEKFAVTWGFELDKINIQEDPAKLPADVLGLPTVIMYKDNIEVSRFTGAKSESDLAGWALSAGV